jgi:hypothetical protein
MTDEAKGVKLTKGNPPGVTQSDSSGRSPHIGDNWNETRRAWRRLRASWRGLWAQLFLNWAIRCDEQAVIDFLWVAIEDEIEARHRCRALSLEGEG